MLSIIFPRSFLLVIAPTPIEDSDLGTEEITVKYAECCQKLCITRNVRCVDMRDKWNSNYLIDGVHLSSHGN